jgi:Asp-tRNA(Asn)/Glu-tRNA(Gln) amidotransferase A subunit family amidase
LFIGKEPNTWLNTTRLLNPGKKPILGAILMTNHITNLTLLTKTLRNGQLSLGTYIDQLKAHFNAQETQILAFLPEPDRFERLHREAADLESRFPNPRSRPLLYGVPVGVKDIFHVDGFATQAGSQLPPETLAGAEAQSVTQLKEAGALILGKTVTTEFAYFAPGSTRNPHNPAHTPGGSSSGSAAAVAAGFCPLALGTQTIGSVIRPAAFCGVVGFKPSFGRISTRGVIPLSTSLDHVGLFTQDIGGATLAARVLVEHWRNDESVPGQPILGVPAGPYLQKADAESLTHFEATQEKLAAAGFAIQTVEALPDFEEIVEQHKTLVAADAAITHRDWFAKFGHLYHPQTAELIERGQQVSPEDLSRYRTGREQLRQSVVALMAEHGIDIWLTPATVGPAPATLKSTGDPIMNLPWTYAGLPAVNLPAGFAANGLPLGLQLVAGWQQDEKLLAWADQISQAVDQGT